MVYKLAMMKIKFELWYSQVITALAVFLLDGRSTPTELELRNQITTLEQKCGAHFQALLRQATGNAELMGKLNSAESNIAVLLETIRQAESKQASKAKPPTKVKAKRKVTMKKGK